VNINRQLGEAELPGLKNEYFGYCDQDEGLVCLSGTDLKYGNRLELEH